MLARMVSENSTMERPDLFIINSLLLHPTSHLNRTLCFEQLSTFKAVHSGRIRYIGGNDPSEMMILFNTNFYLILVCFLNQFSFECHKKHISG